jgi:hypothetical protein
VLDAIVERFERFSEALVRLEPHPLAELGQEVERLVGAVEDHLATTSSPLPRDAGAGGRSVRLELEHERFRTSLWELRGLLGVVERDDHGGHRQALGQYGRILTEALRVHRAEERSPLRPDGPRSRPERLPGPVGTP